MNSTFFEFDLFSSNLCEIEIRYCPKYKLSELPKVVTSADAYTYFLKVFPDLNYREYFYIMCLNRNNRVLGFSQISKGGISGTIADVRIIMETALKSHACSLILAHNHPSGNTIPSQQDKDLTNKIRDASRFFDIQVLDHLILTPDAYLSFTDEGFL